MDATRGGYEQGRKGGGNLCADEMSAARYGLMKEATADVGRATLSSSPSSSSPSCEGRREREEEVGGARAKLGEMLSPALRSSSRPRRRWASGCGWPHASPSAFHSSSIAAASRLGLDMAAKSTNFARTGVLVTQRKRAKGRVEDAARG